MSFSFSPATPQPRDRLADMFVRIARTILAAVIGLVPIAWLPGVPSLLEASKTYLVLLGVMFALVFMALGTLRRGRLEVSTSWLLLAWWSVAGAAALAAVFSDAVRDGILGQYHEPQTAGFLILLALTATMSACLFNTKRSVLLLIRLFGASAFALVTFLVSRLILGADFFSLGTFPSLTASPLGSFNDLGIFLGLVILVTLFVSGHYRVNGWLSWSAIVVVLVSLLVLALVNFTTLWIILALASAAFGLYLLMADQMRQCLPNEARTSLNDYVQGDESSAPVSAGAEGSKLLSGVMTVGVFFVSLLFLVGGSSFTSMLVERSGVSYIEVRPSISATFDVAQSVYATNPLLGAGPNQFAHVWRMHHNPALNETRFWDTTFVAGNSYVSTWWVTTGVLGIISWLSLATVLGFYVYRMVRLSRYGAVHRFWYLVASTSLLVVSYVFILAIVYVPGSALLLISAAASGTFIAAYRRLVRLEQVGYVLQTKGRAGFLLILLVVFVIVLCSVVTYISTRQFFAAEAHTSAVQSAAQFPLLSEQALERVLFAGSVFPHAQYDRTLALHYTALAQQQLAVTEPTADNRAKLQSALLGGIGAANAATAKKPEDPRNHVVLGNLYSILVEIDEAGAYERAQEQFTRAAELAPQNPRYVLSQALLHARAGETTAARTAVQRALTLKPNYTAALQFLAQLQIADNELPAAIETTQLIVAQNPRNPERLYQLGVLYAEAGEQAQSITAFERAVALDESYANARYLLALQYATTDQISAALEQLAVVAELNPENETVTELVTALQAGNVPAELDPAPEIPRIETPTNGVTNTATSTRNLPENAVVTPVNATARPETATATAETSSE